MKSDGITLYISYIREYKMLVSCSIITFTYVPHIQTLSGVLTDTDLWGKVPLSFRGGFISSAKAQPSNLNLVSFRMFPDPSLYRLQYIQHGRLFTI
ncbi:hypothetical protein XELAEV_18024110mg [Xenopus laevis]|uniref:Uncharacterized protein n=1 Tax=Xenopus laevis TaxID=8355 RepID=A0A974D7W3_XENLA|nr:hypothetical protein XELAEV_18024110mg [Xenopus laevis]